MERIKENARQKIHYLSKFFGTDMMYVAKSGFWMNANFIFVSAFGLLSSILFARLVTKEVYGTYQFVLAIAGIIAVAAPNNMSSAVMRAVAQNNEGDVIRATKFQARWGVIASIIAVIIGFWYISNDNPKLATALMLIAAFVPTTLAFNTWIAYLQGKKDFKRYFIYNVFGTIISYGGVLAMLFFKRDFLWIAFGNIFFAFVANAILYFYTIKRLHPNKNTDAETILYGTHLSIMGIPQGLVGQLDAVLIFHFLGAAPLAIYSFATLLPEKIAGGLKFISVIIFPKFSEKNEDDVKGFFQKKIWWIMLFLAIVALLYAIISPYVFQFLFPTYMDSVPFTQVYALSFFVIAASIVQTALVSQKKTKELYVSTLAAPLVKGLLMIAFMYVWGIWGIIWAQIITIVFQILFPIYLFKRNT